MNSYGRVGYNTRGKLGGVGTSIYGTSMAGYPVSNSQITSLGGVGDFFRKLLGKVGDAGGDRLADQIRGGGGVSDPPYNNKAPARYNVQQFLEAWHSAPDAAKRILANAAAAANAPHFWTQYSQIEGDPSGFVSAAYGGSDNKISTSNGKVFNATFIDFVQRYSTSVDGPGNNEGDDVDYGGEVVETITVDGVTYVKLSSGEIVRADGGSTGNVSLAGMSVSPTMLALAAAALYLATRRGRR